MSSNPRSPSETAGAAVVPGGLVPPPAEQSTRQAVTGDRAVSGDRAVTADEAGPATTTTRQERLLAYWLSPPGLVMLGATVLALLLRLFLLSRHGYLTGLPGATHHLVYQQAGCAPFGHYGVRTNGKGLARIS